MSPGRTYSFSRISALGLSLFFFSAALAGGQEFRMTTFADYYGGIEAAEGYKNLRSRIFMRPEFSGSLLDSSMDWVLSGTLWTQPLKRNKDPYAIEHWDILHQAYVKIPFSKVDFTLGQKLVTYGFADVYGPLNVLHSTNAAPLSLDESYDSRRPDPMAQVRFYPTFEDTIEVTYVPVTRPDKERVDNVELSKTGDTVQWTRHPYLTKPHQLHSVFVNYNRYGNAADFQLFYGWYTEHTPDFRIDTVDWDTPSLIKPVYRKKHTLGGAYSTRVGDWTLSQDIAFSLAADYLGRDPGAQNSDLTVNTQVLMNLPGNVLSQFSLVYSYFPYHGNYKSEGDRKAADYLAEEIQGFHTQPLPHIAFLVAHFEKAFLREKLKAQLNAALIFPNVYLGPRLAYSLSDHLTLRTGADYTTGRPSRKDLRRNPANDNYYIRLVYSY